MNKGFNLSDEERNYEASNMKNFNVIHESYNKSKGSEDEAGNRYFYVQKKSVGKKFSSMKNSCPIGSKKISGKAFTDKDGKTIK